MTNRAVARLVHTAGLGRRSPGLGRRTAVRHQAATAARLPGLHRYYSHLRHRHAGRWAARRRRARPADRRPPAATTAGAGSEPDEEVALATLSADTTLLVERAGRQVAAIELV